MQPDMRTLLIAAAALFLTAGDAFAINCQRLSDPAYLEKLSNTYSMERLSEAMRECFHNPAPKTKRQRPPARQKANARTWIGVSIGWENRDYTGRLGVFVSGGKTTAREVIDRSMQRCNAAGRYNCSPKGGFRGRCLSIAKGDDGVYSGHAEFNKYMFAAAATLQEADRKALRHCRIGLQGCHVLSSRLRRCR